MWPHFYLKKDAVIYVVDCSDHDRIENECKEELHHLMAIEQLARATFLIYANKQDLPGVVSETDLVQKLEI